MRLDKANKGPRLFSRAELMALLKAANPSAPGWLPFGKEHTYDSIKLSKITTAGISLAEFWEIGDYDCLAVNGTKFDLALTPVHKKMRNFSYFDGHVGNRRVTTVATGGVAAGEYDE